MRRFVKGRTENGSERRLTERLGWRLKERSGASVGGAPKSRHRNPEARMSVVGHLNELRTRFIRAFIGVCAGAVVGWFVYEPVLAFILEPLTGLRDSRTQINFQTIGAGFDLKMRLSLWIGVIVSSPWWIYQIGAYLGPGLKRKEKIYGAGFGCVGVALFAAGAFSAVRMAPHAVEILQSFVPEGSYSLLEAGSYVTFYTRLVLAFGVSFLVPEVLVALNFLGALSARRMLAAWRWAVVVAFVFAAIANPLPSPWPMTIQAFVLIGLYLVAVLVAWINERIRARGNRATNATTGNTQATNAHHTDASTTKTQETNTSTANALTS